VDVVGRAGPVTHVRPSTVLAVYAHPDDPEVSAGGTLAAWTEAGAAVHLVICTAGEKGSSDPATDPTELAAVRGDEVAAAAEVLGLAAHEVLGFPDGEVVNTVQLREVLVGRIRSLRPEVVVGPDPTATFFGDSYVNHHDHREVGWAVLDACAPAASSPLYFPEQGDAHQVQEVWLSGTLEPDTWVDVAPVLGTKAAALACHQTQLGGDADLELVAAVVGQRAEEAGRDVELASAEAFRRLRLSVVAPD
jgi:LmbE family N-acetylglucosaminyl deacetylase